MQNQLVMVLTQKSGFKFWCENTITRIDGASTVNFLKKKFIKQKMELQLYQPNF